MAVVFAVKITELPGHKPAEPAGVIVGGAAAPLFITVLVKESLVASRSPVRLVLAVML